MALKSPFGFRRCLSGRTRACLDLEITGGRFQYIVTQTILCMRFCQLVLSCSYWMSHNLGISGLKTEHSAKQCFIKYILGILVHCVFWDKRISSPPIYFSFKSLKLTPNDSL